MKETSGIHRELLQMAARRVFLNKIRKKEVKKKQGRTLMKWHFSAHLSVWSSSDSGSNVCFQRRSSRLATYQ